MDTDTDRLCDLVLERHRQWATLHDTDELAQRRRHKRQQEAVHATDRVWRAMVLSEKLETVEALLRGEPVPRSALDPTWARRFGL